MQYNLKLHQLSLMVSLGCTEEERAKLQKVLLDISLHFIEAPIGCMTDEISDTVCYATLTQGIHKFCENKSFKLIEHLTYQLFHFIKQQLPNIQSTVTITKFPPVNGLDHCTFTLSDHAI